MFRSTSRTLFGALVLATLACSHDGSSFAPPDEPIGDLDLAAPLVTADDLAMHGPEASGEAVEETGPARNSTIGDLLDVGDGGATIRPPDDVVEIFTRVTRVGFFPGEAWAEGEQTFSGQGGRIDTTAEVTWDDKLIGRQSAHEQRSWWLSFQLVKRMTAYASVHTDLTCGLAVKGDSNHSAWAELFAGRSAAQWARAESSSRAGPARQAACRTKIGNADPSGGTTTGKGILCTYRITYDKATLVVVDVERLFCQTTGGPLI